jgi:hypothetical protein
LLNIVLHRWYGCCGVVAVFGNRKASRKGNRWKQPDTHLLRCVLVAETPATTPNPSIRDVQGNRMENPVAASTGPLVGRTPGKNVPLAAAAVTPAPETARSGLPSVRPAKGPVGCSSGVVILSASQIRPQQPSSSDVTTTEAAATVMPGILRSGGFSSETCVSILALLNQITGSVISLR